MANNEIDKNKKEILEKRLIRINNTISRINFERDRYGNDYLSTKYDKLINQKEKIEIILNSKK